MFSNDLHIAVFSGQLLVLFAPGPSAAFDTVGHSPSLVYSPQLAFLGSPPASLAAPSPLLVPHHLPNLLTLECPRLRSQSSSFLSPFTSSTISSSLLVLNILFSANDFQILVSRLCHSPEFQTQTTNCLFSSPL